MTGERRDTPELERIVRALAGGPAPLVYDGQETYCVVCDARVVKVGDDVNPGVHAPDCPWRLAREWVASHPADDGGGR